MNKISKTTLSVIALGALAACGGNGGGSSATQSARANLPQTFGLEVETKIPVAVNSVTDEGGGATIATAAEEQFWIKAGPTSERVFRYGRVASGQPQNATIRRHNYQIPVTVASTNGQAVASGTLSVTDRDSLPTGTGSRVFNLQEIQLTNTLAGILRIDETGGNFAGSDIHAYSAGVAASDLPTTSATYNGHFYGRVLTEGAGISSVDVPTTLTVDFAGGGVSGGLGSDATLSGTLSGTDFTGTVTVTGAGLGVAAGAPGAFEGSVFGLGANEAGGTVAVSDSSGAAQRELVGAFAASQ